VYGDTLQTYVRLYPQDANVDFMLIDHHLMRNEFEKAYAAVNRMDMKLGGDPYLNFVRGNIRCSQKLYTEGRALLKKTIERCPEFQGPYLQLLESSLTEKDFATTTWTLRQFRDNLGMGYKDLKSEAAFAEYLKSPEYRKWIQEQGPPAEK